MTDIDQALDLEDEDDSKPGKRGKLKLIVMILVGLLVAVGAGGAVWYFFLGGKAFFSGEKKGAETPLPYFLELKPFVVSVPSRAGPSRFVQLGLSLELPGASSGALVTAILPQAQDALRQSVLGFKADDLQGQESLEKVRAAMLAALNRTLLKDLGAERIQKAAPGKPAETMVRAIYFQQLIVE